MHKIYLILFTCIALTSGCTSHYTDTISSAQYKPAAVEYSLALPKEKIASYDVLSATLRAFAAQYRDIPKPTFVITPSTLPNQVSSAAVRQALESLRIPDSTVIVAVPDTLLKHTEVILRGYTIIAPRPATWEYPAKSYKLANSRLVTGSTVNANIGTMIANPKNSVVRKRLDPADAQYNIKAIDQYRSPSATTASQSSQNSSNSQFSSNGGEQ